ncbi:MAG TPA: hypothetical protein VKX17_06935 [Planctomycetota bacterium]|nr:hypothetical protein [Planctomycetota bacterium]
MAMNDDAFDEILRKADAAVEAPRGDSALAERVRRRARVRARTLSAAASVMLIAAGVAAFVILQRASIGSAENTTSLDPSVRVEEWRAELAQWNAEAESHTRMAACIVESEKDSQRRAKARELLARLAPLDELAMNRDAAAAALIRYGDQMNAQAGGADEAARSYRCVAAHFAESRAAAAARVRLNALHSNP